MTLLYLAVAYLVGVATGQWAWNHGWLGCDFPIWLWWISLALLALTPLINRGLGWRRQTSQLTWPTSAGFASPRASLSPVLIVATLLALITGVLRYASSPITPCWVPTDLAYYNLPAEAATAKSAAEVTILGSISSYPLVKEARQRIFVTAHTVVDDNGEHPVQGELRLSTDIRQPYLYGQAVRLRGRLTVPPDFEDFSYREYLARQGVHSLLVRARVETLDLPNQGEPLYRLLYAFRARGEALLNRLLPEPYAGLANGMLLGIEAGIDPALYEQFNATGTSHTIVISGSNVALIAGIFMAIFVRLVGQRRAVLPTLLGILFYALLVGGDPAVLRAAIMGSLVVIASALGRRSTALVSLTAACWFMTLINPLTLWDVGFQLSSSATAGLILFSDSIARGFQRLWGATASTGAWTTTRGLLEDSLTPTLAANISATPLILFYFGRLSIISLATNLFILPVQPYILTFGSAALVIGVAGLAWLAWFILLVPWLCLAWTVKMVQWSAALPFANVGVAGYGLAALLLTYLLIVGLRWRSAWVGGWHHALAALQGQPYLPGANGLALGSRSTLAARGTPALPTTWLDRLLGVTGVVILGAGAVLIWAILVGRPDGRLHVYFLDIGQGDGILIQTPSGQQVLIDGGADPQRLFNQLGAAMPFWDRSLDMLALTNPDRDHMVGQLFTPTRFQITTALETAASQASHDADLWRAKLSAAGVAIQVEQSGQWIDLGDGAMLQVLWPPATPFTGSKKNDEQFVDNENSLVMRLVYGNFSVLLTGDAGIPAEGELLKLGVPLQSTVLKVGHHGSRNSSSAAFVQAVNPQFAVIQAGVDNSYGHPHQETLDNLAGRQILRNDWQGRVHIYSDGQQVWVETEHDNPVEGLGQ